MPIVLSAASINALSTLVFTLDQYRFGAIALIILFVLAVVIVKASRPHSN